MKTLTIPFSFVLILILSGCGKSSPGKPAETAEGAVRQYVEAYNSQDAAAVWDMVPASYQNQLEDVKKDFARKMDEDLWNGGAALVPKLHSVLKDKKELLISGPMLKQMPGGEQLEMNYDHLVEMLGVFADSDLMTLKAFREMDIREYLESTGAELMKISSGMDTSEMFSLMGDMNENALTPEDLKSMKVEQVSASGESAVIRVLANGKQEEMEFVRVEGKWIPKEMADEFPGMIEEMKEGINDMEITPADKAEAKRFISAADTFLDQLHQAESQQELQGIMMGLMSMMMGM